MTGLIIVLFVLALLFAIRIEVDIDNTIWKEIGTDRSIIVLSYDQDKGVTFRYMDDPFDRYMSIWELVKHFKYEGNG